MVKQVAIFDFDGALFQPIRRPFWDLAGDATSCVPENPSAEWYIGETVRAVQDIAADPHSYVCCWVGGGWRDKDRVQKLLDNVGVWFDEYIMVGAREELTYRLEVIQRLVDQFPNLLHIEMWVRSNQHKEALRAAIESKGLRATVWQVRVATPKLLRGRSIGR